MTAMYLVHHGMSDKVVLDARRNCAHSLKHKWECDCICRGKIEMRLKTPIKKIILYHLLFVHEYEMKCIMYVKYNFDHFSHHFYQCPILTYILTYINLYINLYFNLYFKLNYVSKCKRFVNFFKIWKLYPYLNYENKLKLCRLQ